MALESRRTLLSIQYLRALAALIVVTAHMPWHQLDVGAVGVDIFFVISGFIMAHVSQRETTVQSFLTARILRIVPLYWVVTAFESTLWHENSPIRVMTSLLFIPTLDQSGYFMPIVGQGWTLTYEIFFYFLFGISLLLTPARRMLSMMATFALLCLLQSMFDRNAFFTRGISSAPLFEFLFGMMLHRAWVNESLPNARVCVTAAAAGLLLVLYTVAEAAPPLRVLLWGLPALVIVAAGLAIEREGRVPNSQILLVLGNASYALYLTHPIGQRVLKPFVQSLPLPLALIVILSGCVLIGIAVHFCIEKPMAAWFGRRMRRSDQKEQK